MLFELKLFSTPAVLLLLLLAIGLHAASVFTNGKISQIIGYVNIALHLVLFVPMLGAKFHIEEAVLVYLISFFAYTLISVIRYRADERRKSAAPEVGADDGAKEGEA